MRDGRIIQATRRTSLIDLDILISRAEGNTENGTENQTEEEANNTGETQSDNSGEGNQSPTVQEEQRASPPPPPPLPGTGASWQVTTVNNEGVPGENTSH